MITVVIATFNRRELLRQLLDSLFVQDLGPAQIEIVVVVDGSTDGTLEMLEGLEAPCTLKVFAQDNAGQAAARNRGWRAASNPVVLFLDDDLDCPPDLLAEHLRAHAQSDNRVAFGRIETCTSGRRSLARELLGDNLRAWEQRMAASKELRWPEDAYVAANCSVARRLLELSDGFDPAFYRALEDHELGLRLWAQGAHFVYAPGAVVRQTYQKSTLAAVGDELWYGRAEVLLGRKHPEWRQHSLLASLAGMQWWRRGLLRLLASRPGLARLSLGLPIDLVERFPTWLPGAAAGRRLLGIWMQATRLAGAVNELGGWPIYDAMYTRRLVVLMYHHVGPAKPGTYPDLTVSAQTFERQISALAKRGYRGITPAEYLAWRLGQRQLGKRVTMVTFDDGYADIAEHALPILSRYGFGSCVFVVTGRIAGTNTWDEVRGSGTHLLLSADQIAEWKLQHVEFGGHSRTHASLPDLDTRALHDEVDGCREDLERLMGAKPVAFAYPYGDLDEEVTATVRRHFPLAFSTVEGINHLCTDPHLLHRTMVMPGDSGATVVLRVMLGFSPWDVMLKWRATLVRPVRKLLHRLGIRR
jgi:GT2 family glycosyltransferase/peptidoglycan/xylan/chitin deacetylase (PgdA/CDA1 family)